MCMRLVRIHGHIPPRIACVPRTLQVNATGVMPIIFASSLLSLPSSLARYANVPALESAAAALSPSGSFYLPANVALIVGFNYLYTFLQLDPKDLSDQLKRQGASISGVRPGRATAEFITKTLDRMSVLGEWRRTCKLPLLAGTSHHLRMEGSGRAAFHQWPGTILAACCTAPCPTPTVAPRITPHEPPPQVLCSWVPWRRHPLWLKV